MAHLKQSLPGTDRIPRRIRRSIQTPKYVYRLTWASAGAQKVAKSRDGNGPDGRNMSDHGGAYAWFAFRSKFNIMKWTI
jgi:hypothetical protein